MFLPQVVADSEIKSFNFYQGGIIYQATVYQNVIYKLISDFKFSDRQGAYLTACDLCENGTQSLVSAAADAYYVWVDVRSEAKARAILRLCYADKMTESLPESTARSV
ncbi:MAG: hypothetical protein HC886_16955 [Leptolyngbyaceae cyanobacterium SM1_1_3]|nr:hypothetical protein [Leptolyngbyaceae cyanobacterium SM1_1_3]NJN03073.1 hypothetical protein [Leptolyngbyaceae cyanobacterium RM1_1_2]NJO08752.1 hypothetical protein [Leptolyngbyaceae cyanobacterium SL_1_1]